MAELVIPQEVDVAQLSTVFKACFAANIARENKPKTVVSPAADRVLLRVGEVATLIEGNAVVRFLLGASHLKSPLLQFEETEVWPLVYQGQKLTPEVSATLAQLLPAKNELDAEAAVLFGDLHALVTVKGKQAISAEAPVLMWYQKTLSNSQVKTALHSIQAVELKKAASASVAPKEPKKEAPPKVAPKAPKQVVDETVSLKPVQHPILPRKNTKNILITSALPYVNNVPHLGNIVGSVLSADFYARYCKARELNTLFVCGTDEYGTATETKAIEENVTPEELCTRYYHIHKAVYDWFEIGFDHFGRTSTEKQTEIAQDIFLKLNENGYLEEQSMVQLFCTKHQGYLADRFVEGTCPKCGYDDARGDQCDGCGQLLNPFELINPRCKLDGTSPETRDTKHMFLCLDKLQPRLEEWLKDRVNQWTPGARHITRNWVDLGLRPRAITRDLKWGTPVPLKGYEDKVLYVWFDAPIGYVSITANYTDQWEKWWRPTEADKDSKVTLYQFMGKDNVAFHAVIFPSTELGTGEAWTTVDQLSTTDYLQYEGGKFSKSRNLGVFGTNAQEIGLPPSVWRYYLATARPETSDTQFSWRDFVARNNNELLANLGNFVNRVTKFTVARYGGEVPEFEPVDELVVDANKILSSYIKAMDSVELREGVETAMRFSARGNQFLQENKLDNTLFMEQPKRCAAVIGTALNYIYILSALVSPFMPATARQICDQLVAPIRRIPDTFDVAIKPGHVIGKPTYLFSRIDDKLIPEWKAKYGGTPEQA